jgi:hypothetical protein
MGQKLYFDLSGTGSDHANFLSCFVGKVKDTTAYHGATIINTDLHGTPSVEVCH